VGCEDDFPNQTFNLCDPGSRCFCQHCNDYKTEIYRCARRPEGLSLLVSIPWRRSFISNRHRLICFNPGVDGARKRNRHHRRFNRRPTTPLCPFPHPRIHKQCTKVQAERWNSTITHTRRLTQATSQESILGGIQKKTEVEVTYDNELSNDLSVDGKSFMASDM
jgi:hypothetical protein